MVEDFIKALKRNGLKTPRAQRQIRKSIGKTQKIILKIEEVESFPKLRITGPKLTVVSWIT